MDGVLVDFEKGVVDRINMNLKGPDPKFPTLANRVIKTLGRDYVVRNDIRKFSPEKSRTAAAYMYALVEDDVDFWANLPWMRKGKELWSYISQFDPLILTTPMDQSGKLGSREGKRIWAEKNLGIELNEDSFSHKKYEKAITDGNPCVLIDDFHTNINPWNKRLKSNDFPELGILHKDEEYERTMRFLMALEVL